MKIALIQMLIKEHSCKENTEHGLALLKKAAPGCDIAVLPEIWTTGYSLGHLDSEAEEMGSGLIQKIQAIAKDASCAILAGSIPIRVEGKVYNLSVAVDKDGKIVATYGKAHLFGMFHEERFFAPGMDFEVFDLAGVKCGSTICYDLRFPELYRYLATKGAKIIFCPAEWPSARGYAFDLLSRARALENHVFIAAVNCAGSTKGQPFYGHSKLIAPNGSVIAEASDQEDILIAEADLTEIDKANGYLDVLSDVRLSIVPPGDRQ